MSELAQLIVMVVSVIIGGAIVVGVATARQFVVAKIGETSFKEKLAVVEAAVKAAEQKANAGELTKDYRLAYVIDRIQEIFPDLSDEEIDMWTHSAVHVLNQTVSMLASTALSEMIVEEPAA